MMILLRKHFGNWFHDSWIELVDHDILQIINHPKKIGLQNTSQLTASVLVILVIRLHDDYLVNLQLIKEKNVSTTISNHTVNPAVINWLTAELPLLSYVILLGILQQLSQRSSTANLLH